MYCNEDVTQIRVQPDYPGIGVPFPGEVRGTSLCHSIQTASVDHTAFYTTATRSSFPGEEQLGHMTNHIHVVPRLKLHGAVPLCLPAFMACCLSTGTNLTSDEAQLSAVKAIIHSNC